MSIGEEIELYLFLTHTKFDSQISKGDVYFTSQTEILCFAPWGWGAIHSVFFQFKGRKIILKVARKISEFAIFLF